MFRPSVASFFPPFVPPVPSFFALRPSFVLNLHSLLHLTSLRPSFVPFILCFLLPLFFPSFTFIFIFLFLSFVPLSVPHLPSFIFFPSFLSLFPPFVCISLFHFAYFPFFFLSLLFSFLFFIFPCSHFSFYRFLFFPVLSYFVSSFTSFFLSVLHTFVSYFVLFFHSDFFPFDFRFFLATAFLHIFFSSSVSFLCSSPFRLLHSSFPSHILIFPFLPSSFPFVSFLYCPFHLFLFFSFVPVDSSSVLSFVFLFLCRNLKRRSFLPFLTCCLPSCLPFLPAQEISSLCSYLSFQ